MELFKDQKAQGSTETLMILGLAVVAAVSVGYFVKSFITNEAAPEIQENLDK